jgi:N6-L-threonylcarbamoyladenine synthase
VQDNLADICASIQHIIIETLMQKLVAASKQTGIKEIGIAGGVSANSGLRKALTEYGQRYGWATSIPRFEYCTDNAAMIGITAWHKWKAGMVCDQTVVPKVRQ